MLINREVCIGCGNCVPYCPMSAIIFHGRDKVKDIEPYAEIKLDECVECSVCSRANVCPTEAIYEAELHWPRILRKAFSDPLYVHQGTDVPGRGTEEMKTNDVTGRFPDGHIGVGLEFGRPGYGTRLKETEKAIKKLIKLGIQLEENNPLTQLIENDSGDLRKEVRNEKVLSAIVEFTAPLSKSQDIFKAIKEIAKKIDTVFSLDLICRVDPSGEIPLINELRQAGMQYSVNGKVNIGLGRPLAL